MLKVVREATKYHVQHICYQLVQDCHEFQFLEKTADHVRQQIETQGAM